RARATARASASDCNYRERRDSCTPRESSEGASLPSVQNSKQRRTSIHMKKALLSITLAVVAPLAWGQVSQTTKTTATADASGTITEYKPGSAITLKESSGTVRYPLVGNTATYVTRSGKVLDDDAVKTRVKVGVPVRVHYIGTGPDMVVDRVVLDED